MTLVDTASTANTASQLPSSLLRTVTSLQIQQIYYEPAILDYKEVEISWLNILTLN